MQSKRCPKCGETKTSAEFHRDRTKRDGIHSDCKECRRAYRDTHREEERARNRAYHEANREEILANKRAYYEAHREEMLARNRAYHEVHKEERNVQTRKRKTEAQKASSEIANRNGEPWTPAEDHVVLTSEGTVPDIAIELGRTINSVENRRALLRRKAVTA